jgi:hypothetical protein
MTLNQIRREARTRIRSGQTHQEVYEYFLETTSYSQGEIAGELSKIPSQSLLRQSRPLKIAFIVCLGLLIAFRLFALFLYLDFIFMGFLTPIMLLVLLLGIATPVLGIITAAMNRSWGYQTVAILFTIGILRSLWAMLRASSTDIFSNEGLIMLLPVIGAIIIGYMMPSRLKTPVLSVVRYEHDPKKGRDVKKYDYRFEEEKAAAHSDLLDTDL